jgi:hypothetical protein
MYPLLYLLLLCITRLQAAIFSLDDNIPSLTSEDQSLRFSEGGPGFLLASNQFVRINYRGLQAIPNIQLVSNIAAKGWVAISCVRSSHALCTSNNGDYFPVGISRIGNIKNSQDNIHPQCTSSKGKIQVASTNNSVVYDISACDILEEGLDIVYYQGTVYSKNTSMSFFVYSVLVLFCVFFVRSISLNIMNKFDSAVQVSQYQTVLVVVLLVALMLYEGDSNYVTMYDHHFFWMTMMYLLVSLSYRLWYMYIWWSRNYKYTEPRIFNLSAVCVQLIVTRLYGSVETPYAMAVIGVLATRVFEKEHNPTLLHVVTGLIDCMYMSVLITMGYSYDLMYLFPVFTLSKLVADNFFIDKI